MSKIFESFKIRNIELKNRLMRSATTSYWSDEQGILRKPIIDYYRELAKGGLGLIIKGHSFISLKGKAHTGQSGLSDEKHLPQMQKLTNTVHKNDSIIFAQLNHGGYTAKADRITASVFETEKWKARAATKDDIQLIIEQFSNSAELAMQAGFDGVQIHVAHGYLLSQFLSDCVNKREDEYGGTLDKRAKILLDIFDAIKRKLGNKPPIGVKINCDDFAENCGIKIKDSIKVIQMLNNKGVDFVEISGGGPKQAKELRKVRAKSSKDSHYFEANFAGHAEKIRESNPKLPLALVDGIRSRKTMDALLNADIVDLISMSKPFIIEPDFANKLKEGQLKSECIDCRKCVSPERFGKRMLTCAIKNP